VAPDLSEKKQVFRSMILHLLISYALISPVALLVPSTVFTDFPMTRGFTDFMAEWIPMINRVTKYRHSNTDVLRFICAYSWLVVPILLISSWKVINFDAEFQLKDSTIPIAREMIGVTFFAIFFFFCIWFWPNLNFFDKPFLGKINPQYDARQMFFKSGFSMAIYMPLIQFSVAVMLVVPCTTIRRYFRLQSSKNATN
jgi:hypothetical protein